MILDSLSKLKSKYSVYLYKQLTKTIQGGQEVFLSAVAIIVFQLSDYYPHINSIFLCFILPGSET